MSGPVAYVLIEPDEGYLGEVFFAPTWDALLECMMDAYASAEAGAKERGDDTDAMLFRNLCVSLLKMLSDAQWKPGLNSVPPVEPHWKTWTLVVVT